MSVKDYNKEASLNVSISGINIAEGCAPSGINDAIRQLMADVKEESEAQAEAVAGAESSASEQLTALDSTLRELIAQEVAKYLPLSGGMMTGVVRQSVGDIIVAERDDMWTSVKGGSAHNHGAAMILYGQDHAMAGVAELQAFKNGVGGTNFTVHPGGPAYVNGSPVLTSAGGYVSILELGADAFLQGYATTDDSGRPVYETLLAFRDGARLLLRREDSTGWGQPGMAGLLAQANGQSNYFLVYPDGKAYVNDSQVLTSANGLLMNRSNVVTGNVSGNTFTLPSGGTWAYFHMRSMYSENAAGAGVAAGGTTITASDGPQTYLAIRVA